MQANALGCAGNAGQRSGLCRQCRPTLWVVQAMQANALGCATTPASELILSPMKEGNYHLGDYQQRHLCNIHAQCSCIHQVVTSYSSPIQSSPIQTSTISLLCLAAIHVHISLGYSYMCTLVSWRLLHVYTSVVETATCVH